MKDQSRQGHGQMLAAFSGEYYHIAMAFIASGFTAEVTCRATPTNGLQRAQTIGDMITVVSCGAVSSDNPAFWDTPTESPIGLLSPVASAGRLI